MINFNDIKVGDLIIGEIDGSIREIFFVIKKENHFIIIKWWRTEQLAEAGYKRSKKKNRCVCVSSRQHVHMNYFIGTNVDYKINKPGVQIE